MALGGGTFTVQNKVLPGSYINFVSASRATTTLSDRGVVGMALEQDWGQEATVFAVTPEEFQKNSLRIFGYDYAHEKLKGLRDLFRSVKKAYFYRLNGGEKAANSYATAKFSGTRGNDTTIVISANVENSGAFDVKTLIGDLQMDRQTVASAAALADNDFVSWKKDAELAVTAGEKLSGGTNLSAVTAQNYQMFLDAIESYSFNTLGCLATEQAICDLFVQFTKRLRNEVGVKFQTVLYRTAADYEGVISVENKTTDEGWPESSAVYWMTGVQAGCAVNRSCLNQKYDGEFAIDVNYKQSELEAAIKAGKMMFHKVGDEVHVLDDINTYVSFTEDKNDDFGSNQTIRVLDQIGNDIAVLFRTKYLGKVPNDASGRVALWNDIVKHHEQLQTIQAIEEFASADITVEKGDTKKSVVVTDSVTPVNAMAKLYMTCIVG